MRVKVCIRDIEGYKVDWWRQQRADKSKGSAAKNKANDSIKDGV